MPKSAEARKRYSAGWVEARNPAFGSGLLGIAKACRDSPAFAGIRSAPPAYPAGRVTVGMRTGL